jgi:hypothetical protein
MKCLLAVVSLFALSSFGCAAADESIDATSSELETSTRVMLVAKTDAARRACREASLEVYCSEAAARAAAARCAPSSAGVSADVALDVRSGRCRTGQRVYPTAESCRTPVANNCGFYAGCLERSLSCGEEGYALGFGEKFCTDFRTAKVTAQGDRWMRQTMTCLQEALVPKVAASFGTAGVTGSAQACERISRDAFASHAACYAAKDNSICFLPPSDLAEIMGTIGGRELLRSRTSSQVVSVAGICLGQILVRSLGFRAPRNNGFAPDGDSSAPSAEADRLSQQDLETLQAFWSSQEE